MLGASQFVNVQLFHFSGPCTYLSAQPLPRSFSCDSSTVSFSSSCPRHFELISAVHAKRLTHHLEVMGAVNQQTIQGEEAAGCSPAVYFTRCVI
jgi:hypothetical protein